MQKKAPGDDDGDTAASGGAKEHCNVKTNHRWRKKIRATFPLMFVKPFVHRSRPVDRDGPETVPEADFEEITAAEMEATSADPQRSERGGEGNPAASPPKTRLKISVAQKEELLDWDVGGFTEDDAERQNKTQASAETSADSSQTPASSRSAFQLIANAFRRTFSVTSVSSGANTAVRMRPKRDAAHRPRPRSEGTFSLTSLFGAAAPPRGEEARCRSSVGGDVWGAGRDLPSLLQQVSLKNRPGSGGAFSDDMGSLPPRRRLDLFSSLRLRKREASESEGQVEQDAQKEITAILTNLRNKASSRQNLDSPSSSDDENESLPFTQKLCPERQRRTQEKTVAQQTKRDQLKRLHRAQVIQRQLEEVGEKQRDVEERGVTIEKVIRGETESSSLEADEAQLYQSWFKLVLEKNRLSRYEAELVIFAQELELEDTQSRLQQELRRRMARDDTKKSASELQQEQQILSEIMTTVGKRDTLVSLLEEQRLKERDEDRDLESLVLSKGYEFHWEDQADDSWGAEDAAV